jgi:glycosyltransferase involved in cell wall biosynthesis
LRRWRPVAGRGDPRRRRPRTRVGEVSGLLAPVGDIAALAAAVTRLLEDRKLAARLAATARRHVLHHYCWPVLAERVLRIYHGVARA